MGLLTFEWVGGHKHSPSAVPLLAVENVTVRNGARLVLDDVSLDVYEGEQVRITGPNGAGKSTLLNAITGIFPLSGGRIRFRGEDLDGVSTHARARLGIRYMRQRDNVFPALAVHENLRLALGVDGYELFALRFPEWASEIAPDLPAGMLSGGQKQKLAWAMVPSDSCQLALLDEPSAGVAESLDFTHLRDMTTLWVTHE